MVRKYKPTGNPPGRPRKIEKVMAQTGVTTEQLEHVREAVNTMRSRTGVPRGIQLDLPPMPRVDLADATDPETRAKMATAQLLDALHVRAADMLSAMSVWEPDKALKVYTDLLEFHLPKLARTEYTGGVAHKHEHFVGVEQREVDPRSGRDEAGRFARIAGDGRRLDGDVIDAEIIEAPKESPIVTESARG